MANETDEKAPQKAATNSVDDSTVVDRAVAYAIENQRLVYGALIAFVVILGAIWVWGDRAEKQQAEALEEMAPAVTLYEQGQYQLALDGRDGSYGLLDILDIYGGTPAANLVRYYVADSYFRLGQFEDALEYFDRFDPPANTVGASAIAAQAMIYESEGSFGRAVSLYQRAAVHVDDQIMSPLYLLAAARAADADGDARGAVSILDDLQDRYEDAPAAQEAQMLSVKYAAKAAE